jgi:hypothetical protein
LFLKCALLKREYPPDELKKQTLRHSLDGLLEELIKMGVPISEKAASLTRTLSKQHKKHDLRYSALLDDGEVTFTPEPTDLFGLLDELLMVGRISTHGI